MLAEALRRWEIIPQTANELSAEACEQENISLASIAIDINGLSIVEDRVIVGYKGCNQAPGAPWVYAVNSRELSGWTRTGWGISLCHASRPTVGDVNTSSTKWVQGRLWDLSEAAAEPFNRFGTEPRNPRSGNVNLRRRSTP